MLSILSRASVIQRQEQVLRSLSKATGDTELFRALESPPGGGKGAGSSREGLHVAKETVPAGGKHSTLGSKEDRLPKIVPRSHWPPRASGGQNKAMVACALGRL